MNARGLCIYCGAPVFGRAARELTSAWEIERAAGGAHAVSGPKTYSGRIAHTHCQESHALRERKGLRGQESLL
jgi:hypothetical protein